MDHNQSTAKGFLASLAGLMVVLAGFFAVLYWGQGDGGVTWTSGDERRSYGLDQASERSSSTPTSQLADSTTAGPGVGRGDDGSASSAWTHGPTDSVSETHRGLPDAAGGPSGESLGQPTVDDPQVQKAIELVDRGKVAEATKILEEVLARDPKNEQALVEMAMVHLLDLKQPDVAMSYMQRVVEINPTNHIVLNELVSLYQDQGRLDEGINYLMDLAEKKPGSSDLTYGIGQMLYLSGREQDAVPYIEKAIQSPVHQIRGYRDLAEIYSHLGDSDKSLEYYDKAIVFQEKEISERSSAGTPITYAAERLGYIKADKARVYIQKGEYEAAQALLNEVRTQIPNDPGVAQLLNTLREKKAG